MSETKHGDVTITRADSGLVADRHLFATKDGRVVDEHHPHANELIARKGQVIPLPAVEKFGIEESKAKAEEKAEPKREEPVKHTEPESKTFGSHSIKRARE